MADDTTPPEDGIKRDKTGRKNPANGKFKTGPDPRRSIGGSAPARMENGQTIAAFARENSARAMKVLYSIMENEEERARDRIVAASAILDRAIGKAASHLKIEGAVSHEHSQSGIDPSKLSAEVRRAILAASRNELPAPTIPNADYVDLTPVERPDE
jgi:hypothetical protein